MSKKDDSQNNRLSFFEKRHQKLSKFSFRNIYSFLIIQFALKFKNEKNDVYIFISQKHLWCGIRFKIKICKSEVKLLYS